jgi:hypothetical protein
VTVSVDAPALIVTSVLENTRVFRLVELVTVTLGLELFVKNAVSPGEGKPPVPPAQVAVTLETKPTEQTTLVNPFVSMPLARFVVQAVVLFQTSLPFVQVKETARPREALARNPRAMTAAMRVGVDFRNFRVTGCN